MTETTTQYPCGICSTSIQRADGTEGTWISTTWGWRYRCADGTEGRWVDSDGRDRCPETRSGDDCYWSNDWQGNYVVGRPGDLHRPRGS